MGQEEKGCSTGSVLLAFFLGGVVGAGIALLTAPKLGQETREQIKKLADEAKQKAEVYIEDVKSKASTVVEKGKELLEKEKTVISAAIDAGKEAYEKEKG
ncbi:MAG: YtxH domain-containing protein [Proteobacteria bacterium]|nr:YtxH domain-containing protein [Pseudomonadota bacterium]